MLNTNNYFQKAKKVPWHVLNRLISPIEPKILKKQQPPVYPPVFIIGPARSGTTLIYQSIINNFEVAYFPNLAALLNKAPLFATQLIHLLNLQKNLKKDYSSNYGKISGLSSPSQGYEIWRRWFPRGEYKLTDNILQQEDLKKTVGGIEKFYSAPFINKWPAFSVYIPELLTLFPDAFFIRVTREYSEVAKSVLKGRRVKKYKPGKSITQLPKNALPYQHSSPVEQVCSYVLGIESQISEDLLKVDKGNYVTIRYEEFCRKPDSLLRSINSLYEQASGHKLKLKSELHLSPFSISKSKKVSDAEALEIEKCISRFLDESRFPFLSNDLAEKDAKK